MVYKTCTNSVQEKTMAVLKAGKLQNITDLSQKLELALPSCSGLWIITQPAQQVFLHFETTTLFFHKNVVFPAQAEYSYFSADFRLKIFLYYS